MTATARKSVPVQSSCADPTPATSPLSRPDLSGRYVAVGNVLYLTPHRADRFKRWFAPVFATWLRAHFPNPETVAAAFSVRNSTAWCWWNGDNRASGDAVAKLFIAFPDAGAWFQAEWARQ